MWCTQRMVLMMIVCKLHLLGAQTNVCMGNICDLRISECEPISSTEYECKCNEGYEHIGNIKVCQDIDECEGYDDLCGDYSVCINTPGSYECNCSDWAVPASNGSCQDPDDCRRLDNCGDKQACTDIKGPYRCHCLPGLELNRLNDCVDVDECKKIKPPCTGDHMSCRNTIGSYICLCDTGFKLLPSNVCEDVNECEEHHVCTPHSTCENNPGSFDCVCNKLFRREGERCVFSGVFKRQDLTRMQLLLMRAVPTIFLVLLFVLCLYNSKKIMKNMNDTTDDRPDYLQRTIGMGYGKRGVLDSQDILNNVKLPDLTTVEMDDKDINANDVKDDSSSNLSQEPMKVKKALKKSKKGKKPKKDKPPNNLVIDLI